jgi:hypothetical protein
MDDRWTDGTKTTTDGQAPDGTTAGAPKPIEASGQHGAYYVLTEEERAKGFVRPVRRSYRHVGDGACGQVTTMGLAIAETYARQPSFYGATFCATCRVHKPVGELGEFVWVENDGRDGGRVGT